MLRQRTADLVTLRVYRPVQNRDAAGGVYSEYPDWDVSFSGNLQPYSNDNIPSEFGVDLRYAYLVIAAGNPDVHPLDRIGVGGPDYQVKTVQVWPGYVRIICEKVERG